jgi:translation initiation factor IF-3
MYHGEEFMAIKKNADIEINEQIRDKEVRVIGANGDQLGVMSSKDAYMMAKEADLDLIKIAANATPPVVKIADFGKYRYEMMRKEKEAKKNQHVTEIKEIRMTPNIDTNDLNTKLGAARKFLEKGNKVKVALRFRGREMSRMNQSKYILDEFAEKLKDIAVLDKPAKIEGRNMAIVISPKK